MGSATLGIEQRLDVRDISFCDDPRWILVLRVTESPRFRRSPMLSQFLLFICERRISGNVEDLTEQLIGEHVFRRRPGYSTGEDNIVRTYAHRLRARLEEYFEGEGSLEPIRICIPRGGYAPEFLENRSSVGDTTPLPAMHLESAADCEAPAEPYPPLPKESVTGRLPLVAVFAVLLLGAVCLATLYHLWPRGTRSPAHSLWSQMFPRGMRTYIVTTDNGLGVMQDVSGKYATLHTYLDGSYFAQFDQTDTEEHRKLQRLSRERLTSVPDSVAAASLLLLPEARGRPVVLRNARAMQLNDLKQANLILLGSNYGDPWVTLFEPAMNFQINYHASPDTYESEIVNRHPKPGEQGIYWNNSTTTPYTTYAVIALMPNLDKTGWVLIIEGLTMAGTEAAMDYLLHQDASSLMHDASDGRGGVRPFEAVLKTTSLDSESSSSSLLLERVY